MDNVEPELAASVPPRASYTWEESPEGLVVTFPSPPAEARSVGCAMAILVAALLVFLALAILLAAMLSEDPANTRLCLKTQKAT